VANGGTVYWPRIVSGLKSPDGEAIETYPQARIRDYLRVNPRNLEIVRRGMLEDVESPEGTGRAGAIPGWRIAGKTGTAQVQRHNGVGMDRSLSDTWFVSFAPYENPRYVVVAFVEGGASGGLTCVPVVKKVYEAILAKEGRLAQRGPLAEIPQ
jgi:penicillin-binding protein 2